jgi:hypothetical protein
MVLACSPEKGVSGRSNAGTNGPYRGTLSVKLVANEPDIEGVQDRTITGRTAVAVQC